MGGKAISSALALLLVLMLAERVSSYIMAWREPISFEAGWAEPNVIPRESPLNIFYRVNRAFYCSTDVSRFVVRGDGFLLWRERSIGGSTTTGTHVTGTSIPLSLPPGEYKLRTIVYSACQNGTHVVSAPDIYFTVAAD